MMVLLASLALINPRRLTICIDPGHPSEVGRGTRGRHVTEIHIAWVVAKKLQIILLAQNVNVVLTKNSEDQKVRNKDRAMIANRCHADLLIRLHCDASSGTGFTSYYPTRQGTQHGVTGPSPALLKQIGPIARRFHQVLHHDLSGFLKDNGLKSDSKTEVGSRLGANIGSIYTKVPVVLVEMCVLTNRHDEALVSSDLVQGRLAVGLGDACIKSLNTLVDHK